MTKATKQTSHKIAAAVMIPEQYAQELVLLQKAHNLPPWQPSIHLHITIVSPFTTHESIETLAQLWKPIAERQKFDIRVDGFDRFDDNGMSVFFAHVDQNKPLAQLSDDALRAVSNLRLKRSHQFIPHISLAMRTESSVVDKYVQDCKKNAPKFTFICDRFSLLLLNEGAQRWDVVREFIFTH